MIVLIEATARFGKNTTANYLKIALNGAIVIDGPRCDTEEQIEAFCRVCEDYSRFGDVIVTDAGSLLRYSNGKILNIADLVLVGRLNDKASIEMLGLSIDDVFQLNVGEWINAKESARLDSETKNQIFVKLVTLKRLYQDYKIFNNDNVDDALEVTSTGTTGLLKWVLIVAVVIAAIYWIGYFFGSGSSVGSIK